MLLGIDLGTSSVKALVMEENGNVTAESSSTYAVTSLQNGWAESDPDDWWQAVIEAVRTATTPYKKAIKSIGLSGQMHGVVLCNDQAKPLRPAILWADTRSEPQLAAYDKLSQELRLSLANPVAAGMAGPSLIWLKEHEPECYEKAEWALQPKDWLRFKLTQEVHSEPSDASATLLYDVQKNSWSHDCVNLLGLNTEHLAPLLKSTDSVGKLCPSASQDLGLESNLNVAAGAADAAASALGGGLIRSGQTQINIGTAMQIFSIRETPIIDQSLRTHLFCSATDSYYAMAAMKNAGIALEWVRKILGMTWDDMYHEAFANEQQSDGLLFLPYLTGERTPHLNNDIRALWSGLSLHHSRGHLARAAFEGVAFALKDGWLALQEAGVQTTTLRLSGGGSFHPMWRQLLADTLGVTLQNVSIPNTSARGAALIAALATGIYSSASETLEHLPPSTEFTEAQSNPRLEESYEQFRALYKKNA